MAIDNYTKARAIVPPGLRTPDAFFENDYELPAAQMNKFEGGERE